MLAPIKHLLANKRIILASSSPRRQELVQKIGLNAEICPSKYIENLNAADFDCFSNFVEVCAQGKADEVYDRLLNESPDSDLLVIGADTMVTMGKDIFGKPKDAEEAVQMLTGLADNCNVAYTGVVIKHSKGAVIFSESAKVYFGKLTKAQIQAYVDSGEPLDKAGAYGVSGIGASMIKKIDGDFYTVMGLPLHRLSVELCKLFGYEVE